MSGSRSYLTSWAVSLLAIMSLALAACGIGGKETDPTEPTVSAVPMNRTAIIVVFKQGSPGAEAIAPLADSAEAFSALPEKMQQEMNAAAAKHDSCAVAKGQHIGGRLQVTLGCVLDQKAATAVADDIATIDGVDWAEPVHIAHRQ